jgi:hypothetical protein
MRIRRDELEMDEHGRVLHGGEPYTGEVTAYAANGQLVHHCRYSDGIEDGLQQGWWPDGTKRIEGVTDYGIAVGEWRHWYETGRLRERTVLDVHGRVLRRQRWNAAGEPTMDKTVRRSPTPGEEGEQGRGRIGHDGRVGDGQQDRGQGGQGPEGG